MCRMYYSYKQLCAAKIKKKKTSKNCRMTQSDRVFINNIYIYVDCRTCIYTYDVTVSGIVTQTIVHIHLCCRLLSICDSYYNFVL